MIYLLAFIIPVLMFGILMPATGMYPFGDNALLISDINNQFAAFYSYFKHLTEGNDNFTYTFSKSLGGDMTGFSGYYLRNPFLFLLHFFRYEDIPFGIVIITGISLACMSLTMAILLKELSRNYLSEENNRSVKDCTAGIILFSVSYAFMGYSMAYISLPIYSVDLILLPLVILGLKRLFEGRKLMYIITLCLAIFCNYYIGYMICIFCLLCFICRLIESDKVTRPRLITDFAISSLIAGGLSAFTTVPTILSLRGQKDAPSLESMKPDLTYGIRSLIRNLFTGAFRGDLSNYSAPYIYVGEIALIFVLVFFVSKKIKIKTKICAGLLLIVLLAGTFISTLDTIWHGFNAPVGFAHRQAFVICFILVLLGFAGYIHFICLFDSRNSIHDSRHNTETEEEETGTEETEEAPANNRKITKYIPATACILQLALLTINAYISINSYEQHSFADYRSYYLRTEAAISSIKEEDDSFYRIEKDYEYNHNDSMLFAYNGLTHNSSCDKDYAKEFLARMGIRYYAPIWTFYNQGSTAFADSFLGVKYFISRFDESNKPYTYVQAVEGTDKNGDDRTSYVFQNPYAMPLCFGMTEAELNTDMTNEDLFMIQNELAGEQLYTRANETAGEQIYTRANEPTGEIETDEDISIDIVMSGSHNLYFYATAPDYQGAELLVDDYSYDDYFSVSRWNIVNFGYRQEGETVNIKIHPTDGPIRVNEIYIYEEDTDALERWYDRACMEAGMLDKITSSHLKGSITLNDSDKIVFTIPYEKGWKVLVDGKKVKTDKALGALLSADAGKGDHDIELSYICEGTYAGAILSILSLIALAIYLSKSGAKATMG